MISAQGENELGRVLSTYLGTHIAVGVGSTAPTINDRQLNFEVYRTPITVRSYDPNTNTMVFKASVPEHIDAFINEVAIISTPDISPNSSILTRFDQTEEWSDGTITTTNVRVGGSGLNLALATAKSTSVSRIALSDPRQSDVIQVAYFGAGGTVTVRITNSDTDYHSFSFTPVAGYNVYSIPIYSMTKTGAPDLGSADGITVIHAGTGNVTLDAIRVSSLHEEESLIERQVFASPERKVAGMPLDIEVPLEVTIP